MFHASELNGVLQQLPFHTLRHSSRRFLYAALFALLGVASATLLQLIFGTSAPAAFVLFVAVSTTILGMLAGFCTAAMGALAVDFFYLPPIFHFNFDTGTLRIAIGLAATAALTHFIERQIVGAIRARIKPALGMEGNFDAVDDGEAYGWAFNADSPDQPVVVTAFVEGKPVTQVAAVHYRSDIAEKKKVGSHAFYIDLKPHYSSDREVLVDMRFPNGRSLPSSPKLVKLPESQGYVRRPTILFMHIPKTAGTAFREALAANFPQSRVAYIYPTPPGLLVHDLRELPFEQLRQLAIVIGHFQFGMHEWLPQSFEYVTIVREPVSRVLSRYRYLQQPHAGEPIPSLDKLFSKCLTVDFDNTMVRFFAGVDEGAIGPGQLTEAHYEQAVSNMRACFVHIGHQECLDSSYRLLARRYGWNTPPLLSHSNVSKFRAMEEPDSESVAMIQQYNRWDCLLYQEICRAFPPALVRSASNGSS